MPEENDPNDRFMALDERYWGERANAALAEGMLGEEQTANWIKDKIGAKVWAGPRRTAIRRLGQDQKISKSVCHDKQMRAVID